MHNGTCDHFQLCVCSITPSNHLMHILQPIQCTHTHTNTHFASTAHQYSNVQSIGLSQIASHTNFNPCQAHYFRWKLFLFPTMLTSNVFVIQALNIKYILIDDTVRLKWNHIIAKYLDANWIRRSYCSCIMCSILMLPFNQIQFFNAHLFTFFMFLRKPIMSSAKCKIAPLCNLFNH